MDKRIGVGMVILVFLLLIVADYINQVRQLEDLKVECLNMRDALDTCVTGYKYCRALNIGYEIQLNSTREELDTCYSVYDSVVDDVEFMECERSVFLEYCSNVMSDRSLYIQFLSDVYDRCHKNKIRTNSM